MQPALPLKKVTADLATEHFRTVAPSQQSYQELLSQDSLPHTINMTWSSFVAPISAVIIRTAARGYHAEQGSLESVDLPCISCFTYVYTQSTLQSAASPSPPLSPRLFQMRRRGPEAISSPTRSGSVGPTVSLGYLGSRRQIQNPQPPACRILLLTSHSIPNRRVQKQQGKETSDWVSSLAPTPSV